MATLLAIHEILLRIVVPLVVGLLFLCIASKMASTRYPRMAVLFPISASVLVGTMLLMGVLSIGLTQMRWGRLRAMPTDRITGATITVNGSAIELNERVAKALHNAIATGDRRAGHHSEPIEEFKVWFNGERIERYVYLVARDSKRGDEFWLTDIATRAGEGSVYNMGQFSSEKLTRILNEAIPRPIHVDK
jgi:hypothetical protein